MTDTPHTCRCGARWSGALTAHCSACSVTFSSVGPFDRHRSNGKCRKPSDCGMADMGRSYECWGYPEPDRPFRGPEPDSAGFSGVREGEHTGEAP